MQPAVFCKFVSVLVQLISDVARPSFFSEEVGQEYFSQLTSLIQRSPKLFASDAGMEYLAVFACSQASHLALSTHGKQHYERQVKRVLLSFKQRDIVDRHKRSVFYCLMLKTVLSLTKLDELKAFRLLSTTAVDVSKLEELKELSGSNITPVNLARIALATRFTKLFQSAILLHVNQPTRAGANQAAISKI